MEKMKGLSLVDKKKMRLIGVTLLLVVALTTTAFLGNRSTISANDEVAKPLPAVQTRNFTLYVRDNQMKLPDGKITYVFGYTADPKGKAQVPGPVLSVNEGDTVNLTLINDKDPTKTPFNKDGDGHTVHLHGLDLPSAMDGDPMTAPDGHAVLPGTRYTYHFVANHAGTYYYHCHQEAAEHIQMGMYGALVVHPRGAANLAYEGTPAFDKEYTFVLSEIDSENHQKDFEHLQAGKDDVNWTTFHANYFLINGKAWPDTMMDPTTNIQATIGQKVLVRLINTGYEVHSIHSHGFHFQVIGTDGRKLDQPYYKDTLDVSPGERYELLFNMDQVGRFMFHDHIEQNMTNDGDYPGGMATMINVNNRDGSNPVTMPKMEEKTTSTPSKTEADTASKKVASDASKTDTSSSDGDSSSNSAP